MTKIRTIAIILAGISLLSIASVSLGQSITINSVSATRFCAGDPVSVTFTATGAWQHKNAFIFQLSDVSGSFLSSDFKNLASLIDSVSGTFTIVTTIPFDAAFSTGYRFRVMAANPYIVSADNGTDVSIGEAPFENFGTGGGHWFGPTWIINAPLSIFGNDNRENNHNTIYWDFGADSHPSSAVATWDLMGPTITYSTGGLKTVIGRHVAPGGCSVIDTMYLNVLDCTNPVIPHDAYVVNADTSLQSSDLRLIKTFWVNPGVTVRDGVSDTIYAEAGATVVGGSDNIVYLKPGAMYTGGGSLVIHADGASVPGPTGLACSNLAFDYSKAPANSIMHITNSVEPDMQLASIELAPNPTEGNVVVRHAPSAANVTVMDLLGRTRMELTPQSSDFSLDLSKLASGTYYVRIASGNAVFTKKIVKE